MKIHLIALYEAEWVEKKDNKMDKMHFLKTLNQIHF